MKKKLHFKNQVVVVTSASSGIGYTTARAFPEHGATVALVARTRKKLLQARRDIKLIVGHSVVIPTDVSSTEQVSRLAQRLQQEFGRVDILVNNAGNSRVGSIECDSFVSDTKSMLDVDVFFRVNCTTALLPLIRNSRHGHIINFSPVVKHFRNSLDIQSACTR